MRFRLALVMALVFAAPALAQAPAQPQPAAEGPAYIVTYMEVGPAFSSKAMGILRRYAGQTRRAAGNTGFVALHEHGRPGRLATVETWTDKAALDAHANAAQALVDQLRPFLIAPPDPRLSTGLDVAPPSTDPGGDRNVVYVLTHVDVVPSAKDQAIELVKALCADGRKDDGNEFFDVLQQGNRANHMTLFEAWRDRNARNAYSVAEHTKAFRAKLTPLAGALYDERLYEAVREGK